MAREDLLARTFVALAGVQREDLDLSKVTLLVAERCVELFDASAVGVVLADDDGHLRVTASSSIPMHETELFELHAGEGPCLESYRTGKPIMEPDLAHSGHRWQHFKPVALTAGFAAVHAVPVRLRNRTVGALNLFRAECGNLSNADMLAAQALAQALALTIDRRPRRDVPVGIGEAHPASTDLLIIVEQAKGVLAGLAAVSLDEASNRIHHYARYHRLAVVDVCQQVVHGTLNLTTLQETSRHKPRKI